MNATKPVTDFVPEVFGRLTTIGPVFQQPYRTRPQYTESWQTVRCECGVEKQVRKLALLSGKTKSCGCLQRDRTSEAKTTHGHSRGDRQTPEYGAYQNMLSRCYNTKYYEYEYYGGRGIGVWDTWLGPGGFELWFAEIGPKPGKGYSQDRFPNPNGNYEPGNVRWATNEEQNNNRRNNVLLTYSGETKTLSQWAAHTGINYQTIHGRLKAGWQVEDALSKPARKQKTSSEELGKVTVEVRCLDCWEILWTTQATQDGEPRVRCPFMVGNKCKLIAKGCNCG